MARASCGLEPHRSILVVVIPSRDRVDAAVEAVLFIVRARGEEQRIGGLAQHAVAEGEAPQAVNRQHAMIGGAEQSSEITGIEVERADAAVAEVADQHHVAEAAEVGRRERDAPGGVERSTRREAPDEVPVRVEHADEPESLSGNLVRLLVILPVRTSRTRLPRMFWMLNGA